MEQFLAASITGLATAGIYAVGASGLVLTYTTTGVFNFAHGAIGMMAAFTYWQLRFDWGWPAPLALVVVLLVLAPLFGAVLEAGIMRRLYGTSEATKLVVTIGLLAALIGLAQWIWKPGVSRTTATFFAGHGFTIGGVAVAHHELFEVLAAVAVAVGLRAVLHGTRSGIAMRAAVDDRQLATLTGARADRSAMLAWAIGCSLAAVSGVFFVGPIGLDAGALSLLVVNVYAAALIGRLRSLPFTFLGAVILGLGDAYLTAYSGRSILDSDLLGSPFRSAFPVIVLFVVLLVLPQSRLRGYGASRTRESLPTPSLRGALFFAATVVAGAVMVSGLLTRAHQIDAARILALAIIALSFVPLVGFAGQVSLCQLSFAGVGAVVMAHFGTGGNPFGLLLAVVVAAAVGALVALPALRLSGIYLALATAAFAVALDRWIWNLPRFELFGREIAIFGVGSLGVDRLKLLGVSFAGEQAQLVMLSVVFAALALFVVWLRRGPFGRRLLAMKDSEAACATIGINLRGTKLAVFAISAGIAGLGGALYGGVYQSINRQLFDFVSGLPIFMMVVVGGVGATGGALFAGGALGSFTIIPAVITSIEAFLTRLFGVMPGFLGITMGRNPNGVVHDLRDRFGPLRRAPGILAALVAVVIGLRVLLGLGGMPSIGPLTSSWLWVLSVMLTVVVAVRVAQLREIAHARVARDRRVELPLEWLGIDRPFTRDDVRVLDARLALEEVTDRGVA